jgi:hypothetical protein
MQQAGNVRSPLTLPVGLEPAVCQAAREALGSRVCQGPTVVIDNNDLYETLKSLYASVSPAVIWILRFNDCLKLECQYVDF